MVSLWCSLHRQILYTMAHFSILQYTEVHNMVHYHKIQYTTLHNSTLQFTRVHQKYTSVNLYNLLATARLYIRCSLMLSSEGQTLHQLQSLCRCILGIQTMEPQSIRNMSRRLSPLPSFCLSVCLSLPTHNRSLAEITNEIHLGKIFYYLCQGLRSWGHFNILTLNGKYYVSIALN